MDTKILRDYLEKVRLLESDIYTYDRTISNLKAQIISDRKKPDPLPEPVKPEKVTELVEPEKPKNPDHSKSRKIFIFSALAFFGGAILGALMPIPVLSPLFIIAATAGLYIGVPMGFIKRKKENRLFETDMETYRKEYQSFQNLRMERDQYQRYLRSYNQRCSEIAEYKQGIIVDTVFNQSIKEKISDIETDRTKTVDALAQLYDKDIIYRKYRAFIPVSMFCEYMDANRRSVLDGVNGMYDLYEEDLKAKQIIGSLQSINETLDKIVYRLDGIAAQLSSVQRNQILIYQEVAKGNTIAASMTSSILEQRSVLNSISHSVDVANSSLLKIKDSSEMTAFNSDATKNRVAALHELSKRAYDRYFD